MHTEDMVTRFLLLTPALGRLCQPPAEVRSLGIPLSQAKVLEHLALHGTKTMGEIAQDFGISLPSVTELVNKLVATGFVERVTDKSDRRIVKVRLTPSARGLSLKIISSYRNRMEYALSMLSKDECENLISYLERMVTRKVIDANDPIYNQH